jgi:hypothetical protein
MAPSAWPGCTARAALATAAKVIPGIDPALVAVIPAKADSVAADRGNRLWPWRRFVHLQQRGRLRLRLAWLTAGCSALFVAGGARTGIPQPGEVPAALMSILPVDFHARAGRLLHSDAGRLGRFTRQIAMRSLLRQPLRLSLADKSDAFVAHYYPFFKNTASRRSTPPFPALSAPPAGACTGDSCGGRNGLPGNPQAQRRSSSASSTSRGSASPQ